MTNATLHDAVGRMLEGGEGDPRLSWLSVALGYRNAVRAGRPSDPRRAVDDFTAGLGATPELWVEAAEALAQVRGAPDAELCSLLAVLFSSFRGEREGATRAAHLAASRLCAAALDALPPSAGAPVAVRLARLREAAGDASGAREAWLEALRRDPLLAWALPDEQRAEPAFAALEERAAEGSGGAERDLRRALRMLAQEGERDAGLRLLEQVAGVPEAPASAALMLAAELAGDAARAEPGSEVMTRSLAAARGALEGLGHNPAAGLLRALVAILDRDREGAVGSVLVDLTALSGRADEAAARGIVDALAEMIRRPPYDPRAILRSAYLDAMFDPAAAVWIPRGPLAVYRGHLLGLALAAMMGGTGCVPMLGPGTLTWTLDPPRHGPPPAEAEVWPVRPEYDVPATQEPRDARRPTVAARGVASLEVPEVPLSAMEAAAAPGPNEQRAAAVLDALVRAGWTPLTADRLGGMIHLHSSRFSDVTPLQDALDRLAHGQPLGGITAPGGSAEALFKLGLLAPDAQAHREIAAIVGLVRHTGTIAPVRGDTAAERTWLRRWQEALGAVPDTVVDPRCRARLEALGRFWSRVAAVQHQPGPPALLEERAYFAALRIAQKGWHAASVPGLTEAEMDGALGDLAAARPSARPPAR